MFLLPISFEDLSILLAASAVLLLVTAELVPYVFGEKMLVSDVKKLRSLSIVLGFLFLVTIIMHYFS
jgi:hypothetical protein